MHTGRSVPCPSHAPRSVPSPPYPSHCLPLSNLSDWSLNVPFLLSWITLNFYPTHTGLLGDSIVPGDTSRAPKITFLSGLTASSFRLQGLLNPCHLGSVCGPLSLENLFPLGFPLILKNEHMVPIGLSCLTLPLEQSPYPHKHTLPYSLWLNQRALW